MVEFLLLMLPMLGVATATIGVTWYGFAKAQLAQIAAEGAMQAAEPDSNGSDVLKMIGDKLRNRMGMEEFSASSTNNDGISSVSIELPDLTFLGPLNLVLPGLSVVSDAPSEM